MEQKCEGLQRDKHVRSDRRIRCCCFTVVIQRGKEVEVTSGVHPELPMREVLCILHNTIFLRFKISKHQCSYSYFPVIFS